MTTRLSSSASGRTRRRAAGVLVVLLAVLGSLFSVGAANACACGGPPLVPQTVTAGQSNAGEVTINWSPPADSGTSAVTSYSIGWTSGQAGSGEQVAADVRTDTFTGLSAGTYTFWVHATNSVGDGPRAEVTLTVIGTGPTLAVSHSVRTAANRIVVSGVWVGGEELSIEHAQPGGTWASVGAVLVGSTNNFRKSVVVTRSGSYRVRTSGDLVSSARKVTVKDRVRLIATRKKFRTYKLSGRVYPAVAGQAVRLYVARNHGYHRLVTLRTTKAGYFRYQRTYGATDTYVFKAVTAATKSNASGIRVRRVAVH